MPDRQPAQILAEGKFLQLIRQEHWEYAHRTNCLGAVVVVAITDDGCLVLTEQHRIPVGRRVVELPAGLVGDTAGDEDESFDTAARRELLEETGFAAGRLRELVTGPPSAGLSSEIVTFFLATELRKAGDGGGDHSEDIEVHVVPLRDAPAWLAERVRSGVLVDPKVFAGLYFAAQQ